MAQVVTFPESISGSAIWDPGPEKLSDDEYWAFCEANRDLHIERTAKGEIVIIPPAGGEWGYRGAEIIGELRNWARRDGRGRTFDSSVQFFLPDGSGLSPDAAWVSNESLQRLTKQERTKYLRLTPEFVIEVLSSTDSLKQAKAKMDQWIANGVELGWLIDGDAETVYVYRKGHRSIARQHIQEVAGEGPVAGFVLDLHPIWAGL
ncbi:MAG: Uma2 family endonuclease [Bryobacterales bacterium]|nr:Uma2 family endonuclease [Bryobacterales bacterium]MBV9397045.1 Uma2 family endonuclease [Bryobacterales bacterium]